MRYYFCLYRNTTELFLQSQMYDTRGEAIHALELIWSDLDDEKWTFSCHVETTHIYTVPAGSKLSPSKAFHVAWELIDRS
jgi:uncharacterized protein YegP (UPF0339 family)